MAHPLTQHPPSALSFQTAPRPSPLGFGFGQGPSPSPGLSFGSPSVRPMHSLSFGSPAGPSTPNTLNFGFGASPGSALQHGSPRRPVLRPSISVPANTSPAFRSVTSTLKRSRRSPSPTPSTSPSPSISEASSPLIAGKKLEVKRHHKDELSVGTLALKDDGERRVFSRKRSRKEPAVEPMTTGPAEDMDIGVLLAALPPSAHLPILLNLLSVNPSLNAQVFARIPQPDQNECLSQLEKLFEQAKRKAGHSSVQLNVDRAWARAEQSVDEYCRTASTYLRFLKTPPAHHSPAEPQTVQVLLLALSTQIFQLLRFIPPSGDVNIGTTRALLDLGKSVVASWTQWLSALSIEINQKSGMYPHSTAELWMNNLDTLAADHFPSTSWAQPSGPQDAHHLVESFRSAMVPLRDTFVAELGWLVGRRPAVPGLPQSFMAPTPPMPNNPWSQPSRAVMAGIEDEEL